MKNDDPADPNSLMLCNVKVRIPRLFDDDPVCKAFEKELDRIEAKFRAGRKDKSIGGELGSIIVKKRTSKSKKSAHFSRRSMGDPASFLSGSSGYKNSNKRHSSQSLPGERGAKRARGSYDYSDEEPEDYTIAYRTAVKTEVVKAAKARAAHVITQARLAKGIAGGCVREARKRVCEVCGQRMKLTVVLAVSFEMSWGIGRRRTRNDRRSVKSLLHVLRSNAELTLKSAKHNARETSSSSYWGRVNHFQLFCKQRTERL